MKALDTVIVMLPIPTDKVKVVQAVEAQAEITWDIAKQEGRKEVVDWLKEANNSGDFYYSFDQSQLEAKLKEWGEDKQIADNMREIWKCQADGAE